MRLTLLAIAVTISSAVAENPFRKLADDSNEFALSCVQDIDYNPPCDASSTSCWCQDITFLSRVNHCITDANSKSVEEFCNLYKPIHLLPSDDDGAHISLYSATNRPYKRYYDPDQHDKKLPGVVILGIGAAIAGGVLILICFLRGMKRDRKSNANPYRSRNTLPVVEPHRGRPPPRATQPRRPYARAAQTTREPTPPPPYVREPEAAHVKSGPEEPRLPSYDDQARGSNAV
ncbi:hypothetical protein N7507_009633 [Penicillium longicatenatum]|nr:hypothetical protein N7507_009633 [Penicillium longicatenatum]